MKVNIKKYPRWVGPYQVAEFIFKPFKKKDAELLDDEHPEWCQKIYDWYAESPIGSLNIKLAHKYVEWKESRRVNVRIDDYDVWNMDSTLALIILPMLKKLKDDKQGVPLVDDEDLPEELRGTAPNIFADTPVMEKRWNYVLDEMIFAFESNVGDVGYFDTENNLDTSIRQQKGYRLFGKYYSSLWT
jgi:hypothetical protein